MPRTIRNGRHVAPPLLPVELASATPGKAPRSGHAGVENTWLLNIRTPSAAERATALERLRERGALDVAQMLGLA